MRLSRLNVCRPGSKSVAHLKKGFRASINESGRDALCSLAVEQLGEAAHQKVHQNEGRV